VAEYNEIMNDFGGDDNYTQFIFELLKLYLKEFSDDLDCFQTTPWGQLYVDNQVRGFGNSPYEYKTPYYWWQKGCKFPTWKYGDKGVFVSNQNTCGYFNKSGVELNPMEPVVVYFEEDLDFYSLPPEREERIVSMPAFVLPWLRQKASDSEGMRTAGNVVTIVSSFATLGSTGVVASGLRGALINALTYINKVDAAINVLLTNETVRESLGNIADGKGQDFIDKYQSIRTYLSLSTPTIEGSVIKVVKNGSYTLTNIGGADRPSNCMYLKTDSFEPRVIHSKNEYADLFSIGDKVNLWVYQQHGEYQIVKAQRGQEVLIEHNDVWATIIFVLMIGSLAIVLFEIFVKKILPKRKDG
jgi:hypothetical protein